MDLFGKPISYSYYSKIIKSWALSLGLDDNLYGTHSMRRTKATLIYARTKNIRAVQLLLGHTKVENRYLVGMNIDEGGRPVSKSGTLNLRVEKGT